MTDNSTIKEKIESLARAMIPSIGAGSSNHWAMVCQDIRNRILVGDIDNFLRWHNVVETMVVNSPYVAKYEYDALIKSVRWPLYKEAIKNLNVGNPFPSAVCPESNNNAIHQLYHLHVFETKYGPVEKCNKIIEFGGGYGCLCSIIRKLGFVGEYTIIDFPEFHLIQKYYLNSLGIYNFKQEMPKAEDFNDATLFAFWSLSETDPKFRQAFVDKNFPQLKNFLVAWQFSYETYDNVHFFQKLLFDLKETFNFDQSQLEHIPQNYYVLGDKK